VTQNTAPAVDSEADPMVVTAVMAIIRFFALTAARTTASRRPSRA